jgi:hypothetical protein
MSVEYLVRPLYFGRFVPFEIPLLGQSALVNHLSVLFGTMHIEIGEATVFAKKERN